MSYKSSVFKISFTGMMFSLVLLFQFLEKFMSLGIGYVKLNISLIFILVAHFVAGLRYALSLFLLRFLFGPAIGSAGYSDVGLWSHFILLAYGFIFFIFFILIYKRTNNLVASIVAAVLQVSLVSGLLNGALFTPVYWAIATGNGLPTTIAEAKKTYSGVKDVAFLGIPSYWGGMFAIYSLTNLIKFSIAGFVLYSVLQVLIRTPYKRYVIGSAKIKFRKRKYAFKSS